MAIIDQLNNSQLYIPNITTGVGPNFESVTSMMTSDIQAYVNSGDLQASQDLLDGRSLFSGNTSFYVSPSDPPVSVPDNFVGSPFNPSYGGPYNQKGPADGRY